MRVTVKPHQLFSLRFNTIPNLLFSRGKCSSPPRFSEYNIAKIVTLKLGCLNVLGVISLNRVLSRRSLQSTEARAHARTRVELRAVRVLDYVF